MSVDGSVGLARHHAAQDVADGESLGAFRLRFPLAGDGVRGLAERVSGRVERGARGEGGLHDREDVVGTLGTDLDAQGGDGLVRGLLLVPQDGGVLHRHALRVGRQLRPQDVLCALTREEVGDDLADVAALRERGMGSAWTTLHLPSEREAAELLGIPFDKVTQGGLFPIAYTVGTDFKPAKRLDTSRFVHWNQW